ncbi:MAG: MazG nucleotide pyrophosphohydrolase domain-containing protein [Chloroflexota bacterium]
MKRIYKINEGLDKLFPDGRDPFQMITRLAEECGELAAEVNHFEDSGVKRQKHGEPDPKKMAKEIQDVIRCALRIATYYNLEAEVEKSIDASLQKLMDEGVITA